MEEEDVSRSLIIDGVLLLRDAKSPSLVREMLIAYLPEQPSRTSFGRSRPEDARQPWPRRRAAARMAATAGS